MTANRQIQKIKVFKNKTKAFDERLVEFGFLFT